MRLRLVGGSLKSVYSLKICHLFILSFNGGVAAIFAVALMVQHFLAMAPRNELSLNKSKQKNIRKETKLSQNAFESIKFPSYGCASGVDDDDDGGIAFRLISHILSPMQRTKNRPKNVEHNLRRKKMSNVMIIIDCATPSLMRERLEAKMLNAICLSLAYAHRYKIDNVIFAVSKQLAFFFSRIFKAKPIISDEPSSLAFFLITHYSLSLCRWITFLAH